MQVALKARNMNPRGAYIPITESIVSVRQDIKSGCIGIPFLRRNHNPVIKPLQTFRIRDREV